MCANFVKTDIYCDPCDKIAENEKFVDSQTKKYTAPERPSIQMQTEDSVEKGSPKKHSNQNTLPLAVITVCLLIIGVSQFLAFQSAYKPIEPENMIEELGIGSLQRCILVFREIGSLLRSAQTPNESMRCDDSGTPNILERTDGNIKVSHPHPDFYGYKEIYVSRSNTEPTLIK
ncbi:MAG: hypothetical protein ACJAS2_000971 [Pseudohongiellaceae bacterium]|jgi:hypothetical protein